MQLLSQPERLSHFLLAQFCLSGLTKIATLLDKPMIEPGSERHVSPLVFKIIARAQWEEACLVGSYSGSLDDERDGHIHLSAPHQVEGTLKKHFASQTDLLLVAFESADLGTDLRWESSRGGDIFPHLYACLRPDLALWQKPLALDQNGNPTCDKSWLSC